ncbi:transposase [Pontibacter qinzhouensis]|nr:transposase [Pontibacter qinzhouensis]
MAHHDSFSKKNRRLQGYDYRAEGLYFITICTKDRLPYFGEVRNGLMELSDEGIIARDYWLEISDHNPQVLLGEFVVMPNHVHGIIGLERASLPVTMALQCKAATVETASDMKHISGLAPKAGSISRIIGAYKAACTRMIRSVSTNPFAWQNHFHDRIICNGQELQRMEAYIISNPEKWAEDKFCINY